MSVTDTIKAVNTQKLDKTKGENDIPLLNVKIDLATALEDGGSLNKQPNAKYETKYSKTSDGNSYISSSSSSSSSETSSSSALSETSFLDGGWGWMVVLASFMAHVIADGCCYSAGVLLVKWLEVFEESKAKTSWIVALFVSLHAIFGPISSICTNKFGCRKTTIAGGLISALGCILSVFTNSVEQLCLTFGLVAGFGLSLVYVPAVVIVAFYFEKKRAFATGIAVAGSGIGGFVFPILVELLVETYSWRGALLIMGGIMLNIVLCGALFRPIVAFKKHKLKQKYLKSLEKFSRVSSRHQSGEQLEQEIMGNSSVQGIFKNGMGDDSINSLKKVLKSKKVKTEEKGQKKAHFPDHVIPKYPQDVFYRGSLWKTGFLRDRVQSASCPDIFVRSKRKHHTFYEVMNGFRIALKNMMDFSIFKSPVFICFCLHSLMLYVSYDIPYMYLPDLAKDLDISATKASLLLSISGISSTIGQIVIGFIGDRPKVNSRYLYISMISIAGISTLFVPIIVDYWLFVIYCLLFGFTISANYCLTTIIVVDVLGMEQLTNAYGFVTLAEGIANLVGVPLAGCLTDWTGTYELAFYLSGIGVFISATVLFLMNVLSKCDPLVEKKERNKRDIERINAFKNCSDSSEDEVDGVGQ
ncbi:hypothetical protein HELRODRAFT_85916 [Helobdella robusta]|uniref:Major facilitator superfamily (MFS) profile domain-containing protein n=1 Tax=Helobdella robusta TaxID=6412 RepID=T1G643_HELRO|nr:hypothetical protein HELRODRAFT_85916 [Helobdella robusta]ESN96804.1 hypothetical protein HELRODRAFT_85916 [Helobdella robusta]